MLFNCRRHHSFMLERSHSSSTRSDNNFAISIIEINCQFTSISGVSINLVAILFEKISSSVLYSVKPKKLHPKMLILNS